MSNSQPAVQETPPFDVLGISIGLARDSRKMIKSIELKTKNNEWQKVVEKDIHAGEPHLESSIHLDNRIHALIKYNTKYRRLVKISVDIDLRGTEYSREDQGVRSYRKKERNIEVIVTGRYTHQTLLIATTTDITQSCSQFRLLIIGNSGVGKSSLIRKVFGVEEVHISESTRGRADIDQEFVSPTNSRFVVHDSLGFEAADARNMDIVKEFVDKRKAMSHLNDQLHAIWLCLEIPYAGGRLLEAGVGKFLQNRAEVLGEIPLVVVLTKVDLLDAQLELEGPPETLEDYKTRYMNEYFIEPLRKAAGNEIVWVAVSSEDDYANSLSDLVKTTDETMKQYDVHEAKRVAAVIAQRVSLKSKIDASIAIGKKKYWRMLLKSAVFRGHTMEECLQVIRRDIITVWNFNDEDQYLMDNKIIEALFRADGLGGTRNASYLAASFIDLITLGFQLARNLATGDPMSSALASTTGLLASVAQITYEAFQEANRDVKLLMVYIIDLICVVQVIFLLASDHRITPEMVDLALQAYQVPRSVVHQNVSEFNGTLGVLLGGRDYVLDKVEELIWKHCVPDHEIEGLRKKIYGILP